jgi:hypothetical protein
VRIFTGMSVHSCLLAPPFFSVFQKNILHCPLQLILFFSSTSPVYIPEMNGDGLVVVCRLKESAKPSGATFTTIFHQCIDTNRSQEICI